MTESKGKRKYYGQQILAYLTSNADRPVTVEELTVYFNITSSSVSAAMGRFMKEYPGQMVRKERGVYMWLSNGSSVKRATPVAPEPAVADGPDALLLEVILNKKGVILAQDSETGQIYSLKSVDI